jgi:hypothetical protein
MSAPRIGRASGLMSPEMRHRCVRAATAALPAKTLDYAQGTSAAQGHETYRLLPVLIAVCAVSASAQSPTDPVTPGTLRSDSTIILRRSQPHRASRSTECVSTRGAIGIQWTDNSNNEDGFCIERSTAGTTFTGWSASVREPSPTTSASSDRAVGGHLLQYGTWRGEE